MVKFYLQWHITPECDQRCKFCYLFDGPTYELEKKNIQNIDGLKKILSNFLSFCNANNVEPHISFTGGDPLLHPDFLKLCKFISQYKIGFSILGNPYHLDKKTLIYLKKYGLESYQMSIDGLEEMHDYFRKPGSFKATTQKFQLLKDLNVKAVCMFTLSKKNKDDLIPLIEFINNKVDVFDFARMVPIGKGSNLKDELLNPSEYRVLLLKVLDKYLELEENNSKTRFGRKDHLWKLLYYELGLSDPLPNDDIIYDGCHAGITHITIISDGTILLCRRLPLILGNALKDDIDIVFKNNAIINDFRKVENRKKCNNCELLNFCRGCPAVGYGITEDLYAEDPQCWK